MVVHILVHGQPVCGFSYELPCNWPIGHKWVRAEEHSDATCNTCKKVAFQAFPPKSECADDPTDVCMPSDDDDWDCAFGYI